MSTRVYVPSTMAGLRALVAADGIGPAPFIAHAVTEEVRAAYAEGGEEEWEYAASAAASRSSLGLIEPDDEARRVVLAVDVETVLPGRGYEDATVVEVGEAVSLRRVAAVLVDSVGAAADVRAAADRWADAEAGDAAAETVVDRALDHELGWYATQEIGDLLGLPR